MRLEALLNEEGVELLAEKLAPRQRLLAITGEPLQPEASLGWQIAEQFPSGQVMKGHGEERRISARVVVQASLGGAAAKSFVYEQSVRAGLSALLSAVEDGRPWVIPPADLWWSTAAAVAARERDLDRLEEPQERPFGSGEELRDPEVSREDLQHLVLVLEEPVGRAEAPRLRRTLPVGPRRTANGRAGGCPARPGDAMVWAQRPH